MLVNTVTGIIFTAVTGSLDQWGIDSILDLTRDTIDDFHRTVRPRRPSR